MSNTNPTKPSLLGSAEQAAHPQSEVRSAVPAASDVYGLKVGDLISGKFRIERIIGEGGMGLVVAATHLGLEERVALKVLHPQARKNPEALARFFQEARSAAKLKSEHVAHVLDVSEREDGMPFIVMEFLRGCDLRHLLNVDGALPVEVAVDYIVQSCEALAEAHARGIIHRDIKPENLFLTERSQGWRIVKILDFGISKAMLASAGSDSNIRTGNIMGSPLYMSPEQLRETSSVDHRTDIWALGTVLYELLAGRAAFDPDAPLASLVLQVVNSEPFPLDTIRPELPRELVSIVSRCMRKDRNERYASAAELAVALLPFASRRARVAAERAVAVSQEAGLPFSPVETAPTEVPPSVRRDGFAQTALAVVGEVRPPLPSRDVISQSAVETQAPPPSKVERKLRAARRWTAVGVVLFSIMSVAFVAGLSYRAPSSARLALSRAPSQHSMAPSAKAVLVSADAEPAQASQPAPLAAPPPAARKPQRAPQPPSKSPPQLDLDIRSQR